MSLDKPSLNESFLHLDGEVFETLFTEGIGAIQGEGFSRSWEAMGSQHHSLATAFLMRRAQTALRSGQPEDQVYRALFDFIYRFFGYRQIVLAADMMMLMQFDVDDQTAIRLIGTAKESPYITPGKLEATIMGISGLVHYSPERMSDLTGMDMEKHAA